MKISLSLLLIFIFLISSVNSLDESFQYNREFDLKRACFDRGSFCGSDFECNITLIYPDGTTMVDNQVMTDQGSFRNITVSQALNNQLGVVKAIESCTNSTDSGAETFEIEITADGFDSQDFPTQFVIVLFAFVLVGVGHITDKLRLFQVVGAILMLIMGVLTLYPGYSFINYSVLFGQALGISLIGLGFYFMISHNFSRDEQQDKFDQRPEGGSE